MMLLRSLPLAPALALFNGRADAQSSLGVQGFSGDLAYGIMDDGRTTSRGLANLDVAITGVHGLQLDFGLLDTGTVTLGQIGTHIYMRPRQTQKYGLFATLSDVDEFSVQYMNAGLEGRFGLSANTAAEFRVGLGGTTSMAAKVGSQWDYAFAGIGMLHDLTDTITVQARIDVTEFDETGFSAIGVDSQVRLFHSARGSNFEAYAELTNHALFGDNAAPTITSVGVGITLNLGTAGDSVMDRPFQVATPFDQLIDRDIVALE